MSNRRRLRAPGRQDSRIRYSIDAARQFGMAVRESATAVADPPAAATRVDLVEASTGTITSSGGRRYRARLIEGDRWGSSGFWSKKVVERDGPKAFPIGTLSYLNHPTATEEAERPERDVKDLAARIVSTPVYEGDGLYADIEVFPHTAPLIESLAATIGLSIRGEGTGSIGEAAGRTGVVIESLDVGHSVDFVTRAGAGGKLVSLLEAARASGVQVREARNVGAYIESRLHLALTQIADDMYGNGQLTRDERIALSQAVGDGLTAWTARITADAPQLFERDLYDSPPEAGDTAVSEALRLREATADETRQALCDAITDAFGVDARNDYVWVRDYDPDKGLVWYEAPDSGEPTTWQQAYTATGTPLEVTLADTRVEVVARTVYDPAPPDAEDAAENDTGVEEAARDQVAEAATTTTTPDVTDGAPPAAPNPSEGSAGMPDTQNTGPEPGAAGTNEPAISVPAAVTEARTELATTRLALDEANRDRLAAQVELARFRAVEAARPIASTVLAESQLPAAAQAQVLARVTASVPLTEANVLDEAVFRTAVAEAITAEETYVASLREGAGEGRVAGLGNGTAGAPADNTEFQTAMRESFVRLGMAPEAAALAARGRA